MIVNSPFVVSSSSGCGTSAGVSAVAMSFVLCWVEGPGPFGGSFLVGSFSVFFLEGMVGASSKHVSGTRLFI